MLEIQAQIQGERTPTSQAKVITHKSERSYLSSVTRRTEENGKKVVFLDTSEAETES